MTTQSGSSTSRTMCFVLLVLTLTLAQDDYSDSTENSNTGHNYNFGCSPSTNGMNGIYYIMPEGSENTSCPAQPCVTLAQLPLYCKSGNTSLVFLPGMHTLRNGHNLDLYAAGEYSSLTLTGYYHENCDTLPTAIIDCTGEQYHYGAFHLSSFSSFTFSSFKDVTIKHLQLNKCVLYPDNNNLFVMDCIILNDPWLNVKSTDSVVIMNSQITAITTIKSSDFNILGSNFDTCECVLLIISGPTTKTESTLTNVSFSSDHSPSGETFVNLINVFSGILNIADSTFSWKDGTHIRLYSSTLYISGAVQFENGNTAIQIIDSTVHLAGNVSFISNSAYQGGALFLHGYSHVIVADTAHVIFQSNHADHIGGAIFSTGQDVANYLYIEQKAALCQILFQSANTHSRIGFINNTAESGGSAMYGITLNTMICGSVVYDRTTLCNGCLYGDGLLYDIFTIDPDEFSAVSSDPLRVCICPDQSTPDCLAILPKQNIPHLHYTVFPGQKFTIPAAVVGFNFVLTSGSVYAQFLKSDAFLRSNSQYVQGVSHTGCSPLQYNVLSDKKQETLVLTTNGRRVAGISYSIERDIEVQNNNETGYTFEGIMNPVKYYINNTFATNLTDGVFRMAGYVPRSLQDTPVFISLTFLDCPLGFTFSDECKECECNERILAHNLTCNITYQTVHRTGSTWINASFSGNSSNGVIVHQHCPFGYCNQQPVDVHLMNPDAQCAFNRSGTLCGACKPNFSLALGSSQCLSNCSNRYLSLLIPFALAGFALVFFIKILNLTVSQGTINALIFYANIVAANQSIFFPAQYNKLLSFLSVFISWLNLDLGIEVCFIKGLDGYWKTWLQFVFPFYVWAIAGAIILVSHYSTRATKIFGNNSIPVLATLFLLSYAKLLRSIITIFSFTSLVYPDRSSSEVWAFDGNVQYFSPKHIPLFIFALATVLLLWLPYTAVLLSAQWLRTKMHHKGLQRLKPFVDAYYGSFKDKHYNWVGVLLAVRGVLFVFFASFFAIESNVNLLLIIVSSVSLLAIPRRYKLVYISLLENSFFLNLGVLAAGTFYIRLVGGNQAALITTSVGMAFLQFVGITAFHSYCFVIVPFGKKCKDYFKASTEHHTNHVELEPLLNAENSDSNSDDEDRPMNVVTHSEVRLSELRKEAAQLPLSPTTAEHQLSPAKPHQLHINENTAEILIPFDHDTPRVNINLLKKPNDAIARELELQPADTNQVHVNGNTVLAEILIAFDHDTPGANIDPALKEPTDATTKKATCDPKQSKASVVPLDEPPPPQEYKEPSRYFAAKREGFPCVINFTEPREPLLEYTQ